MRVSNQFKLLIAMAYLCYFRVSCVCSRCSCSDELDDIKKLVVKLADAVIPPSTCEEVLARDSNATSGVFTLKNLNGQEEEVFCQFGAIPGSGCSGGAWRRVAFFDRETSACPQALTEFNFHGKQTCSSTGGKCNIIEFPIDQSYTRVCGRVQGYGVRTPDSFAAYPYPPDPNRHRITDAYIDGVGITYGKASSLNHLWSYAATAAVGPSSSATCPCATTNGYIPPFVGDNYYCEGGSKGGVNDILWDGKGCHATETPSCCNHPNQPWFERDITATSDPIQLRVCTDQSRYDERIAIFQYELYVQ